jgi:hypothetical protein
LGLDTDLEIACCKVVFVPANSLDHTASFVGFLVARITCDPRGVRRNFVAPNSDVGKNLPKVIQRRLVGDGGIPSLYGMHKPTDETNEIAGCDGIPIEEHGYSRDAR